MARSFRPRRGLFAPILCIVVLALAACGGENSANDTSASPTDTSASPATTNASTGAVSPATKDERIASMVPEEIREKGTLEIATDATYAPLEFVAEDGETLQGLDIDLGTAIAQVFGLEVKFTNTSFDTIIPAVQAGKFDLSISSFNETAERQEVVDQVRYYSAGNAFVVRSDAPPIKQLADLCGKTVALQSGTAWIDDVNAQSARCKAAGNEPVKIASFSSQDSANLALQSNRAQIGIQAAPAALYLASRSDGALKVTGSYGFVPRGIVVPKGSPLTEAVQAAVQKLMDDGIYAEIFEKWNMTSTAVETPTINGATP